jgi:AcrR family transcriptional regulator
MIAAMQRELAVSPPVKDRRVRRSRAALMRAAVALVAERGTAAVALSDIAEAADVSRQVVYQHFGDRETLLLEAALDLARAELLPRFAEIDAEIDAGPVSGPGAGRAGALALTSHFAEHRAFYRAMLNSSAAFALTKALSGLMAGVNRGIIEEHFADALEPQQVADLTRFITGGGAAVVNEWVIEAPDPLDPEDLADRLAGMVGTIVSALSQTAVAAPGAPHPAPTPPPPPPAPARGAPPPPLGAGAGAPCGP